jgi:hypothetical protein
MATGFSATAFTSVLATLGVGTTRLEIVLTADATPGIVQQLVRAIRFRTEGASSTTSRVVEFFVTDGDGGASDRVTKSVVVA